MAEVNVHNVAENDLIELLRNTGVGQITETSAGLNLPMIRNWIRRGAGHVNSIAGGRNGVDIDNLSVDQEEIAQEAILNYAYWRCMQRISNDTAAISVALSAWNSSKSDLRNMPADFGEAYGSREVSSNIDTSNPTTTSVSSLDDVTEYF